MAVCCVLVLTAGCTQPEAMSEYSALPVAVLPLSQTSVELTEDLPGRVAAVRVAEIRPQVSGIVERRIFDQGIEVTAGQPLFQIDARPFRSEVDMAASTLKKAEAALDRARIQEQRLRSLVKADAISQQVYDDAVSQRDQAVAEVSQATANLARRHLDLKFATVEAPISGRIDQALITEGALVGASDANPMARIQQLDQVYIDVRQPANSLDDLRETLAKQASNALTVMVLRANGSPYGLVGRVLFSGVSVDEGTGDVLLRVLVDNPRRDLLPGMFVRARIPLANYPSALMVPQQAVQRGSDQASVWVVRPNNHAKRVSVDVGELVNRSYRIRSGLEPGQRVVVEGMERLTDDALVAPTNWRVRDQQVNGATL